jgi:hypothetical protein
MGAFADLQCGSGCAAVLGSQPVIVAAGELRLPVESRASPRLTGETPVAQLAASGSCERSDAARSRAFWRARLT